MEEEEEEEEEVVVVEEVVVRGARDIFGCFWNSLAECLFSNKMLSLLTASPVAVLLGSVLLSSRSETIESSRKTRSYSLPDLTVAKGFWSAVVASLNAPDEMRVSRKFHLSFHNGLENVAFVGLANNSGPVASYSSAVAHHSAAATRRRVRRDRVHHSPKGQIRHQIRWLGSSALLFGGFCLILIMVVSAAKGGKMELKRGDGRHCELCGSSSPKVRCEKCGNQIFCLSCDDMYHRTLFFLINKTKHNQTKQTNTTKHSIEKKKENTC